MLRVILIVGVALVGCGAKRPVRVTPPPAPASLIQAEPEPDPVERIIPEWPWVPLPPLVKV